MWDNIETVNRTLERLKDMGGSGITSMVEDKLRGRAPYSGVFPDDDHDGDILLPAISCEDVWAYNLLDSNVEVVVRKLNTITDKIEYLPVIAIREHKKVVGFRVTYRAGDGVFNDVLYWGQDLYIHPRTSTEKVLWALLLKRQK